MINLGIIRENQNGQSNVFKHLLLNILTPLQENGAQISIPKRALLLNERPHYDVDGKPDIAGADATAAAVKMKTVWFLLKSVS